MSEKRFINVSKIDAAKRQLEFAINAFFHKGDFVVIHTLVSAAKTILKDLGKKQGIISSTDEMMKLVKKDKQKFVIDKLHEAQNFFKHAEMDSDKLLKFNPVLSEYYIWESIELYVNLTQEVTSLMKAFRAFFYVKNPNILLDEQDQKKFEKVNKIIGYEDRGQFLELVKLFDNDQIK